MAVLLRAVQNARVSGNPEAGVNKAELYLITCALLVIIGVLVHAAAAAAGVL